MSLALRMVVYLNKPWFTARYARGVLQIVWREGGVQARIHTGVEPESIEVDGPELTIRLSDGRTLLVDGRDGETIELDLPTGRDEADPR
jgi:hypothetical protein